MNDSPTGAAGGKDPVPATPAAKNNTIDILSEHFAQDHLTLEDFEDRVSKTHRAQTVAELESLLGGLPTSNVPATFEDKSTEVVPRTRASVPSIRVKDNDRAVSVFGETKRVGQWVPARETQVVAVMGSTVLDLREALLGPGETTFKTLAIFGSVEVIVPPGLYVECGGSAVFGSFEQYEDSPRMADPDAPVVRIDGFAVFGSVEVDVRHVDESRREARRRRKREKKERRRLRSGR